MSVLDQIAELECSVVKKYGCHPVSISVSREIYTKLEDEAERAALYTSVGGIQQLPLQFVNGMEIQVSRFLDKEEIAFYSVKGTWGGTGLRFHLKVPKETVEKKTEKKIPLRLIRL
jgi:hypothetical protein